MSSIHYCANVLARAFAAGDFETDKLVQCGSRVLAKRGRWLRPLAGRLASALGGAIRPRKSEIVAFLLADPGFRRAHENDRIQFANILGALPKMSPVATATTWRGYRELSTPHELSSWLGLDAVQLLWLADPRQLVSKQNNTKLHHYRYRLLPKRPGEFRLIEAPKPRLKAIQRMILEDILTHVPPHEASHGFRRGRSISTFATPHINKAVVLKMDLEDFFPSIGASQVHAIFRFLGYPESVADLLTGLCTTATPLGIWPSKVPGEKHYNRQQVSRYTRRHLPQGAPTSPALANLCAYRLDCRLFSLAKTVSASYTRYADDIVFSGDEHFDRVSRRFSTHVAAVALEQGYAVHFRKTRIMKQATRQRIAGVVVNQRLNISRADYDLLKAILTNCVRHGPDSQNCDAHANYRSHLEGRVSFVERITPDRGRRLRELLERIDWSA